MIQPSSMSELGRTTLTGLPYALDDVDDNSSVYSADYSSLSSTSTTGYRTGGPKEARLRRVALLSSQKDVEHLHAVKVEQIPTNKKIDKLGETLQQNFAREFGDVGDVYVPTNLKSMTAKHNFAVIRFRDEDAAKKALSASVKEIKGEKGEALPVIISPMNRQKTFYSNGTGYLGITNEAFDDGTRSFHSLPPCEQDIEISSCMARSGYPWASKRELKFLSPHQSADVLLMHGLKITNIPVHLRPNEVKAIFERYGEIGDVSCPKSKICTEKNNDGNSGYAFVRFADKRDMMLALGDLKGNKIVVHDNILGGEVIPPLHWPTEKTRRYY